MTGFRPIDELMKVADVSRQPPHVLFADNARSTTRLSVDAEVNKLALDVQSGNAQNLDRNSVLRWADNTNDDDLTPEEREEKERERNARVMNVLAGQNIVTAEMFNDLYNYYQSELEDVRLNIAGIDAEIAARNEEISKAEEERQELQEEESAKRADVVAAEENLKDADNSLDFFQHKLDRLEAILKKGGAIDNQGNEYDYRTNENGEKEFFYVDEAGREHVASPDAVTDGAELASIIQNAIGHVAEAEVVVERSEEDLARVKGIYDDFMQGYVERLEKIQQYMDYLEEQNKLSEQERAKLVKIEEELEEKVEFLKSDEIQKKLESGDLTEEDLRTGLNDDARWNMFAKTHSQYGITPAELDENEQKQYARLEKWDTYRTQEQQELAYLNTQETVEALKSGALNVADTIASVGETTWNWFVATNPQHQLASVEIKDPIQQQKFEQRFAYHQYQESRKQAQPAETVQTATNETAPAQPEPTTATSTAPVETTPTIDTASVAPTSTTATTLAAADGQGIQAESLKGSFINATSTLSGTPQQDIAPTPVVVAAQQFQYRAGGASLG